MRASEFQGLQNLFFFDAEWVSTVDMELLRLVKLNVQFRTAKKVLQKWLEKVIQHDIKNDTKTDTKNDTKNDQKNLIFWNRKPH